MVFIKRKFRAKGAAFVSFLGKLKKTKPDSLSASTRILGTVKAHEYVVNASKGSNQQLNNVIINDWSGRN